MVNPLRPYIRLKSWRLTLLEIAGDIIMIVIHVTFSLYLRFPVCLWRVNTLSNEIWKKEPKQGKLLVFLEMETVTNWTNNKYWLSQSILKYLYFDDIWFVYHNHNLHRYSSKLLSELENGGASECYTSRAYLLYIRIVSVFMLHHVLFK